MRVPRVGVWSHAVACEHTRVAWRSYERAGRADGVPVREAFSPTRHPRAAPLLCFYGVFLLRLDAPRLCRYYSHSIFFSPDLISVDDVASSRSPRVLGTFRVFVGGQVAASSYLSHVSSS